MAAAKFGPADPLGFDPAAARAAFGRASAAWRSLGPRAARGRRSRRLPAKIDPAIRVGFVELPGSPRVFNAGSQDLGHADRRRRSARAVAGRFPAGWAW